MLRTVLFDFDGTLIDSHEGHIAAFDGDRNSILGLWPISRRRRSLRLHNYEQSGLTDPIYVRDLQTPFTLCDCEAGLRRGAVLSCIHTAACPRYSDE
jgi:FMN phosphatase YigB (HAD superfamily)